MGQPVSKNTTLKASKTEHNKQSSDKAGQKKKLRKKRAGF
jgi:hypothetical protein